MLPLFADKNEAINRWLEENPLVLGGIALLLGLVLVGFGVKALLTGVSHSKWGTEFRGPMANLHGAILAGFGGLCILFALYKIAMGLLTRGAPAIAFVLATAGLSGLALAVDAPKGQLGVDVLCVDEAGKPIAGAEVHLFQHSGSANGGTYLHHGPMTSDATGKASFPQANFSSWLGDFDRWVYARIPGKLVGTARSVRWKTHKDIINPEARVRMFPSRSLEGTVSVPQDVDPSSVKIVVRTMHIKSGDGDFDFESFPRETDFPGLDTALLDIFETQPTKAGQFQFHDVPERGRLYLIASGPGLGEAQWTNDWKTKAFDKPATIDMQPEKKLLGRVVSPKGEPVAGVEVSAQLTTHSANLPSPAYLSTFRTTTNGNGEFEIAGLPARQFHVRVKAPNPKWVMRPLESVASFLDKAHAHTLKLEEAIVVAGEVVDTHGKAVEGAAISAITDSNEGTGIDGVSTDRQGRFQLLMPSGPVRLYFNSLPDGFKYPEPQPVKELILAPGQAAITDLVLTLERKTTSKE